jgi:hypothetical protein
MQTMRQSWTDERLDDFRAETARRFDVVDLRFDAVDQRLGRIESSIEALNGRFYALNRTLMQTGGGILATLIAAILLQLA